MRYLLMIKKFLVFLIIIIKFQASGELKLLKLLASTLSCALKSLTPQNMYIMYWSSRLADDNFLVEIWIGIHGACLDFGDTSGMRGLGKCHVAIFTWRIIFFWTYFQMKLSPTLGWKKYAILLEIHFFLTHSV